MNNNQQPKPDPRGKAIASFVLGIVGIIWTPLFLMFLLVASVDFSERFIYEPLFLWVLLFTIITIFGLILGVMGLKSTKRTFARIGIVLCAGGLLLTGVFVFIYFWGL